MRGTASMRVRAYKGRAAADPDLVIGGISVASGKCGRRCRGGTTAGTKRRKREFSAPRANEGNSLGIISEGSNEDSGCTSGGASSEDRDNNHGHES